MTSRTVLVLDDVEHTRESWVERLREIQTGFNPEPIDKEEFRQALEDLNKRRGQARGEDTQASSWGQNLFDDVAILLVDFDLFKLRPLLDLTGDEVAYLVRCYSQCGFIAGVNRDNLPNPFDLTLRGHLESFSDLNIGERQIASEGLWKKPWTGFRPWYWPLIPNAVDAFNSRVRELGDHLREPILEFLGFPEPIVQMMPRSTREFIEPIEERNGVSFRNLTFYEFVSNSLGGLRRKDKPINDESIARIAAARVGKWLERTILSGQDILVDAPHLVSRFPSLLTGQQEESESWNKTCTFSGITKMGIRYSKLKDDGFTKKNWVSRPVWFWPRVSTREGIAEVADPWSIESADFVFCEDISQFLPREATREFVADLPSQYVRRHIVNLNSQAGQRFSSELSEVDFFPRSRLAL